jgi:hypothetical protein
MSVCNKRSISVKFQFGSEGFRGAQRLPARRTIEYKITLLCKRTGKGVREVQKGHFYHVLCYV